MLEGAIDERGWGLRRDSCVHEVRARECATADAMETTRKTEDARVRTSHEPRNPQSTRIGGNWRGNGRAARVALIRVEDGEGCQRMRIRHILFIYTRPLLSDKCDNKEGKV